MEVGQPLFHCQNLPTQAFVRTDLRTGRLGPNAFFSKESKQKKSFLRNPPWLLLLGFLNASVVQVQLQLPKTNMGPPI